MSEDRVVELRHPGSFSEDPLTAVLRSGAQRLLAQAVEMEVTAFIAAHGDLEDDAGRRRVVRHGHHRERRVQTGIGPVAVRCPRVRDRGGAGEAGKIRFTSAILPPYLRRAKSIEELLPWLYLKGISTGDFTEALAALLGPDAPGLSASTITRLKDVWQGELARWEKRDLSARRYLYFWADGIYFQPRMEHDKQCILVIIGADQWGRKELLAIADGYRESAQSWRELLLDLKRRGLEVAPELAVGDGALGFWKALAREPRHDARTALLAAQDRQRSEQVAQVPPSQGQGAPAGHLVGRDQGSGREGVRLLLGGPTAPSTTRPRPAWPRTARCCSPSTTSRPSTGSTCARPIPIESTFATVRLRTIKTKGCLSRTTALTMVFKLCQSAARKWRRLDGSHRLAEIVEGVKFKDGEKLIERAA